MSNFVNPEIEALEELEEVVRRVCEEADTWRRRALIAEAEQRELGKDHDAVGTRRRIMELEARNKDLEGRLTRARERVSDLLAKLRFLEDQVRLEEQRR